MGVPSLDNEFMQYWAKLTVVEKQFILSVTKSYVQLKEVPESSSVQQYNREIDEALRQAASRNYMTQEEIEKESEKW